MPNYQHLDIGAAARGATPENDVAPVAPVKKVLPTKKTKNPKSAIRKKIRKKYGSGQADATIDNKVTIINSHVRGFLARRSVAALRVADDATLACESPRDPADIPSPPADIDTIASLRAQIEASNFKMAIKFAELIDDTNDGALESLKDIVADLPKKRGKKSPLSEAEIADALRAARMDALNKKFEAADFIDIRAKFDIPDADTQTLEGVANQLLIDFLQKIKTKRGGTADHFRERTDTEKTGDAVEVDFGKGAAEYSVLKGNMGKFGVELPEGTRVAYNMGHNQCKLRPALRDRPIDKCVGCSVAVKWDYQNNLFKKDAEGVYQKDDGYDFGFIPCNTKCKDGNRCARHLKAKKALTEWSPEMFKDCALKIV